MVSMRSASHRSSWGSLSSLCAWSALCLLACESGSAAPTRKDAGDSLDAGVVAAQCQVKPPETCTDDTLTYADVETIFKERCTVCHNGAKNGPWPLTTYQDIVDWTPDVRGQVAECLMPPADGGVAMSRAERAKILMWLRCGAQK